MTWMKDEEYSEVTGLNISAIDDLIQRGKLDIKMKNGMRYIDPSTAAREAVPAQLKALSTQNTQSMIVQPEFVEKTIGTIINLHEKVIDAKDETLDAVRVENAFLRQALESLQELYDEDRNTIATLTEQLKISQTEAEFMKRKYKLMWNKAIEEHGK